MKIIRLSTFLDFGGVETRLANVSHVRDENEWVFVCMNKEGQASTIIRKNGKRVVNLHTKPSIYSFKTIVKVYQLLKREKPDVIHTSGAEANFHGILAAKLAGVPKIIGEEIGMPGHGKKARFIFSQVYKLAHYVVGNSDLVLSAVHGYNKLPIKKLKKIKNPIIFRKLPEINKKKKDIERFEMLMISRLEPVKNIEGVLNVLSRLVYETKHPVRLTIAGSGSSEIKLKEKAKKLNLESHIDFIGFINDPYPYLLASDLYILNSYSEGFSNSLIEAMYSKTPSLSTNVGAAPEIIEDGVNGFIVPVDDEEALYEKIKNIIEMPEEKRVSIGLNGHCTIVENFSLEKHIEELMKIYKN